MSTVATLEARVVELELRLKTIEAAPALRAFLAEQERIAKIRRDVDAIRALVTSTPEERAKVIGELTLYQLQDLSAHIEFADRVEIARGLPAPALGTFMRAAEPAIRRRIAAEIAPLETLGKWVRIASPGGALPGADAIRGARTLIERLDAWETRCAANKDLAAHVAAGRAVVTPLTEREARDHVAQAGTLDEATWSIAVVDPHAEAALKARRIDAPARKPAPPAVSPHEEAAQYRQKQAAREREQRIEETAAAVEVALKRSSKKGPTK